MRSRRCRTTRPIRRALRPVAERLRQPRLPVVRRRTTVPAVRWHWPAWSIFACIRSDFGDPIPPYLELAPVWDAIATAFTWKRTERLTVKEARDLGFEARKAPAPRSNGRAEPTSNTCSILLDRPCGRPTATSPAGRPSTASGTWASSGRSTRTWAASTSARSASSEPSSGWPIGRRTRATARRSGSRRTSSRSSGGARPPVVEARAGRRRHGDRPVPAGRGPLPPDPRRDRGPRRRRDADRHHHARAADRPRRRRPGPGLVEAKVGVTFSIPTLDPEIWRRTEPGTAPPRQRLRAIRTLIDAGIEASVGMAPILPGPVGRPGEDGRRRPGGARRGGDGGLDQRPVPPDRGRGSTSSRTWRATGRSSCRRTSGCTTGAPTWRRTVLEPVKGQVRDLAATTASPTGGPGSAVRPAQTAGLASPRGTALARECPRGSRVRGVRACQLG